MRSSFPRFRSAPQSLQFLPPAGAGRAAAPAPALVKATAQAALAKLTANWRSVIEDNVIARGEQADRKRGRRSLFE